MKGMSKSIKIGMIAVVCSSMVMCLPESFNIFVFVYF